MLIRVFYSLAVWVIVALISYLVGTLLSGVSQPDVSKIGSFLSDNAGLIGLLAGIFYFFFGSKRA